MKQAILKTKKSSRETARDRSAGFSDPAPQTSADGPEKTLEEESPWLLEIQNALSPYWSARFDR